MLIGRGKQQKRAKFEQILIYSFIFLLTTFVIPICGAVTTTKFYDSETETVTVTDYYNVTLIENTDQCINCETTYRVCNLYGTSLDLNDFVVKFYDQHESLKSTPSTISKLETKQRYITIPVRESCMLEREIVIDDKTNETEIEYYESVCVVGEEEVLQEYQAWTETSIKDLLLSKDGCITFKVSGNLARGESIDNRINLLGVEINEFAWWNNSWQSKHQISYTCNNPYDDCTDEFMQINYTSLTNCDDDIRFVHLNTTELPFEINSTNKLIYVSLNGTSGVANTDYSFFCDNDLASDGSTTDFMMQYDDCEDVSDWSFETGDTSMASNVTAMEVNRTGYGATCDITVGAGGQYDWAYKNFTSTDTGTIYMSVLYRPDDANNGGWGDFIGLSSTLGEMGAYSASKGFAYKIWNGAETTQCSGCSTNDAFRILKFELTLDASDTFTLVVDGTARWNGAVRPTDWDGSVDKFTTGGEVLVIKPLQLDQMIVSRYNVSSYHTLGTISLGSEELVGGTVLEFVILNSTGENTSLFSEGEDFSTSLNLTHLSLPLNDSNCTLSLPNGLVENDASDDNFSLCSTCDFDTFDFDVVNFETVNAVEDTLIFNICHGEVISKDLEVDVLCGATVVDITVDRLEFPLCSIGTTRLFLNLSGCENETVVNSTFSNTAVNNQRHQITGLEHDRMYSTHLTSFTYNSSSFLYEIAHEHEYYEHGVKEITAECENPIENRNITKSVNITIENVFPTIFHTLIETFGQSYNFIDGVSFNTTNESNINFDFIIQDDDIFNVTHNITNSTGALLFNFSHIGNLNTVNISGVDIVNGSYNFTTFVIDTQNGSAVLTTEFEVGIIIPPPDSIFPNVTFINPNVNNLSLFEEGGILNLRIDFNDTNLYQYNVTIFDFLTNERLQFISTDVNVSLINFQAIVPLNTTGTWRILAQATDQRNTQQIEVTFTVTEDLTSTNIFDFDIDNTTNILILFLVTGLWVALLIIGRGSFVLQLFAFLLGFILGVMYLKISWIITFLFMVFNGFGIFSTLTGD